MVTILDYTSEQEQAAGASFSKLEREHPEVARMANELTQVLGLHGFWKRVNSARWECAKTILVAKGMKVE